MWQVVQKNGLNLLNNFINQIKVKDKLKFIVWLLFALMFINAGLNKFFNYMPMPDDMPESMLKLMAAFASIGWLMPLVAVVEIVGGLLFLFHKTRALGAVIILPVMVGIFLTNIFDAPSGIPIAFILFLINIWTIFEYKEKYLPLLK